MIKHIVLWRMNAQEKSQKRTDMLRIKAALEALLPEIPELKSVEVGFNQNVLPFAYDLSLITVHDSFEGLKAYQQHPKHQAAAALIGELTSEKAVSDYEI